MIATATIPSESPNVTPTCRKFLLPEILKQQKKSYRDRSPDTTYGFRIDASHGKEAPKYPPRQINRYRYFLNLPLRSFGRPNHISNSQRCPRYAIFPETIRTNSTAQLRLLIAERPGRKTLNSLKMKSMGASRPGVSIFAQWLISRKVQNKIKDTHAER